MTELVAFALTIASVALLIFAAATSTVFFGLIVAGVLRIGPFKRPSEP